MYKENEVLLKPQDNEMLWKYMSLPKFLNLLNGRLYFSRIDLFEDVFESTFPEYNELYREKIYVDSFRLSKENYDDIVKYSKKNTYVSCFHKNTCESAFMWKLYAGEDGLAIVTDVSRLKSAFNDEKKDIFISDVRYIDYSKEFIPESNIFFLSIHKRKSFSHENEVRCIYLNDELDADKPAGRLMAVDLKILIQKVYISPYAPAYMRDDVENILRSKGIEVEVIYSPLYTIK